MAEPQGGGGIPVTPYEAIVLALLGHEPMAKGYGPDEDWCGLSADDVVGCIRGGSLQLVEFETWGPFAYWPTPGIVDAGLGALVDIRERTETLIEREARSETRADRLVQIIEQRPWELQADGVERIYDPAIDPVLDIEEAIGWICHGCRDDVMWVDSAWAERVGGVVTFHIQCGRCGSEQVYDSNGDERGS
jgi:hypothetical protein